MLNMTREFLIKAHNAFDELGYRPDHLNFNYDRFCECAIKTLNRTEELQDAIEAAKLWQFVNSHFGKIHQLANKHERFWNSLSYADNELLSIIDDEKAQGSYFITNAIESNYKKILLSSVSYDDEQGYSQFEFSDCQLFQDSNYTLHWCTMDYRKMTIVDKNNKNLCAIFMDNDGEIVLKNNFTSYEIVNYDSGAIGIYEKEYIKKLDDQDPNPKQMIASIEWDILSEKSKLGLAKTVLFDGDGDLELFLLFSLSTFILFKRRIDRYNATSAYFFMNR